MKQAYYSKTVSDFLSDSDEGILGSLSQSHGFDISILQKNSWFHQIRLLKKELQKLENSFIIFEFMIPRMGKRIDNIIIYNGIIFTVEFKVGEKGYPSHAIDQVYDYSLDLKNFHDKSHDAQVVPILISTDAFDFKNNYQNSHDKILKPIKCNASNWLDIVKEIGNLYKSSYLEPLDWLNSSYKPTPTIIEAAQALYANHNVDSISRSDSGATNLKITSNAVSEIISSSKDQCRKSICFITGVPGSGKTLAGLNIAATQKSEFENNEDLVVFLSGNGPLVKVLQEALARDNSITNNVSKKEALRKTSQFIQNIHHFRDSTYQDSRPPIEKVTIFDEAQRAWDLKKTSSFMKVKKGITDFDRSEPEFLISVMDRHKDWAVIICLIGGGQEINSGEAGIKEWFDAINKSYSHWDVYLSDQIINNNLYLEEHNNVQDYSINSNLHLSVSLRSFRSELISDFFAKLLSLDLQNAKKINEKIKSKYPICITRDLNKAREWLSNKARGNERTGIICSSGALRLKKYGINVKAKIECTNWFLNNRNDVRSSNFLEDVATEFDIQGLEIDWACLAWDANLRLTSGKWEYKKFIGTKWNNIKQIEDKKYLLNSYRVLLTRARQGLIIFIPEGDPNDETRLPAFYDEWYETLLEVGLSEF